MAYSSSTTRRDFTLSSAFKVPICTTIKDVSVNFEKFLYLWAKKASEQSVNFTKYLTDASLNNRRDRDFQNNR